MAGEHIADGARPFEIGVRELRRDLSGWLRAVREGVDVVVTDRGRPVARLVGIQRRTGLDRLIAAGAVRMPLEPRRPSKHFRRVKAAGSVAELIRGQRK